MSEHASSEPPTAPSNAQPTEATAGVVDAIVVDADERTRASLVGLLAIRGRVRVLGDAGQASVALGIVRTHHPDVVIVDPRLPDLAAGLAFIRTVRTEDRSVRILAMGPDGPIEPQARDAGADAFVRKTFRPDELADAVIRCATVRRRPAPPGPGIIL